MIRRFIVIVISGAVGVFIASMQAFARETSLSAIEAMQPQPDPHRHAATEPRTALADTTRKAKFHELASAERILSSREKKRKRLREKGWGKADKKFGSMEKKSRR